MRSWASVVGRCGGHERAGVGGGLWGLSSVAVQSEVIQQTLGSEVFSALRRHWGFDTLRPLQDRSIAATLAGRDSLTVLPTGGGKSLCFQLPPVVTGKLTLVVSPLIALMDDQVAGLKMAGVPACAVHSNVPAEEAGAMRAQVRSGELRVLFTSPERLLSPGFMGFVSKLGLGHVAIDEAHCISQWGHDFRPEFRRLRELRAGLPGVPMGAYTATATPQVRADIIAQLGLVDPVELVGNFDRPNLTYRVLPRVRVAEQVSEAIGRHAGRAAIVYCLSRKNTEEVAATLCARGIEARAYHAGMDAGVRARVSADFRAERLDVVVATVAFGMGIDRGDVRLVVHASMPKSVEHYQQETGRAGRDGLPAECLLLYSAQDVVLWRDLMDKSGREGGASPGVMDHAREMLDQMHRFASGASCRHKALTRYFGQELEQGPCGACDFCLDELQNAPEMQETARKIISCVARLSAPSSNGASGFGAGHLCDVLTGSRNERVRRLGHDKLSTHGLLQGLPKERIASYVNQLVDQEVLARQGEFNVLVLTELSRGVLKNELAVRLVDPKAVLARAPKAAVGSAQTPVLSREEMGVFEALRMWRRGLAASKGVPPFVILGDATLEELSLVRPGSMAGLLTVRGIGTRKVEDFGPSLLEAVAEAAKVEGLQLDARGGSRPTRALREGEGVKRSLGADAAAGHFAKGLSIDEVAALMGRATSTVAGYLQQWIEEARPMSVEAWVPGVVQEKIVKAWEEVGRPWQLRPVMDALGAEGVAQGGAVTYEQIRVVMAFERMRQGQRLS